MSNDLNKVVVAYIAATGAIIGTHSYGTPDEEAGYPDFVAFHIADAGVGVTPQTHYVENMELKLYTAEEVNQNYDNDQPDVRDDTT